jgi:putative tryptophan/tyrosine transport system substrate-binding protein
VPRIGILETGSPSSPTPSQAAFRQGLRDLGYVEAKNILLEYRYAEGRFERLPALAAELTHLKVDVLVTSGSQPVHALKQATSTIPIVGVVLADPIGTGFAASFARPGGNITGLAFQNADLSTKRLELLMEAVPGVTRVAVLWDSHFPASPSAVRATEEAARALGLQVQLLEVQGPEDFARVVAAATQERAQALFQVASSLFATHRETFLDLVAKSRLPVTCETRPFVVAGCLMTYGPSFPDMYRRAAYYVDRILKGAKPADLPVEQPMKFELVINLKTAEALGLTIPPTILFQADEVIR